MTEHCIASNVEAFLLMWDAFPEPAMLIGHGRKVLAANALCRDLGVTPGGTCGGLAPVDVSMARDPMAHLRETASAFIELVEANGQPVLSYWVPVAGNRNIAVHFGIGVVRAIHAAGISEKTGNKNRAIPSFPAGELIID